MLFSWFFPLQLCFCSSSGHILSLLYVFQRWRSRPSNTQHKLEILHQCHDCGGPLLCHLLPSTDFTTELQKMKVAHDKMAVSPSPCVPLRGPGSLLDLGLTAKQRWMCSGGPPRSSSAPSVYIKLCHLDNEIILCTHFQHYSEGQCGLVLMGQRGGWDCV